MRKWLAFTFFISLLLPALATAQSTFDGTWKFDLKTVQFPSKPDVYLLQDGIYNCKTCVPVIDIKADGQDQKVSGHPYYDTVSIKVVDDHSIEETDKKNGKTVATSKTLVSADGNTLTFEYSDSSNTNGDPVTGKGEETRLAKGPAGSHAISGSWRMSKMDALSENAVFVTFKVSGDSLTMTNQTGQSYTAKLDGTETPVASDAFPSDAMFKILSTKAAWQGSALIITQTTSFQDTKGTLQSTFTLSDDGKTLTKTTHVKMDMGEFDSKSVYDKV